MLYFKNWSNTEAVARALIEEGYEVNISSGGMSGTWLMETAKAECEEYMYKLNAEEADIIDGMREEKKNG